MMNQEEKICRPHQAKVRCFQTIPDRFELNENSELKSCSLIFPPFYSIYIEEFILDDPGPDNFVLIDGIDPQFRPKLKWEDREQTRWKNLDKSNPLNKKSNRRENFPCVETLKVIFINLRRNINTV